MKPLLLSRLRELAIRSIGRWTDVNIRPEDLLSLVVRIERAESALEEAQALLDKMDREGFEAFGASRDDLQNTIFTVFAARNEDPPEGDPKVRPKKDETEICMSPLHGPDDCPRGLPHIAMRIALNGVGDPNGETIHVKSFDFVAHTDSDKKETTR